MTCSRNLYAVPKLLTLTCLPDRGETICTCILARTLATGPSNLVLEQMPLHEVCGCWHLIFSLFARNSQKCFDDFCRWTVFIIVVDFRDEVCYRLFDFRHALGSNRFFYRNIFDIPKYSAFQNILKNLFSFPFLSFDKGNLWEGRVGSRHSMKYYSDVFGGRIITEPF